MKWKLWFAAKSTALLYKKVAPICCASLLAAALVAIPAISRAADSYLFAVEILSGTNGRTGVVDASTVTVVPEPESYAMMLAGLGLMGFVARRRSTGDLG